jgi:hypothetical protein
MTRIDQIAGCIEAICTLEPGQRIGLFVGGLDGSDDDLQRFDVEVRPSNCGQHVWDSVVINGHCAGNRHGGAHYLLVAIGEREPTDDFCDRQAIAHRKAFCDRLVALSNASVSS